jgi:ABC-type glycerol-3-phosphate transport system permease component/peptidoglycan/LPS O-acetylase OafA/YrhL
MPFLKSSFWFVVPFYVLLCLFAFAPLFLSLVVSFAEWNPSSGLAGMRFDGLWAFEYTLQDGVFWQGLWRSLRLALFTAVGQQLLAIPLAFFLHIAFKRVQGRIAVLLFLPMLTLGLASGPVVSDVFDFFWRGLEGVFAALQGIPILGGALVFPSSLRPEALAALTQLWQVTGLNVLLYLLVYNTIPRSLYEAAQLDGAGVSRLFFHIALPLLRPMIFVAFTLSFLRGTQTSIGQWFGQISDIRSIDLPTYIIRTAFWDGDFGLASAQTWVFFLGIAALVLLFYWFFGRHFTLLETTALHESDGTSLLFSQGWRVVYKLLVVAGVLLCVVPVLNVFLTGTRSSYSSQWLAWGSAWSDNYARLLEAQPTFWRNVYNSTYIAGLATVGGLFVSSLAAFAFAFLQFRYKSFLYGVVLSVMLFPSLLNLIPTALNMAILGWTDQARAVWVPGLVSAFGVFLLRQYLPSAMPKSLLEAARIDGATDWRIYWQIAMPLARPALATLGLILFLGVWNNNSVALALLKAPDNQVVVQILGYMLGKDGSNGAYWVGSALASLVPMAVFLLCAGQIAQFLGGQAKPVPLESSKPIFYLPGADAVRGIACLLVILHHLMQRFDAKDAGEVWQFSKAFFEQGSAGVSAFFVLSGMLLALPFWRAYLNQKPMPNMLEYTRRRAVRIVPGFYAALLVSFVVGLFFATGGEHLWLRLVAALTFTSAFSHVTLFPTELNGPLWSISFEVFCYALMPLGMWLLFARFPARGFWFAWRFWLVVLALVFVVNHLILTGLVPDNVNRGWQYGLIGGAKYWMPNYNAIGMFAHFALGILAAGLIVWRQQRQRHASLVFDALGVVGFIGMVAILWFWRGAGDFGASFQQQPFRYPFFALSIALILVALPFSRVLGGFADNRFLRFTAKISFGLYIWHFLILELVRLVYNDSFRFLGIQDPLEFSVLAGVSLAVAYVAAAWSYRHIESPFL